ncbi:MAG: DUF4251 domain-containing protein [Flavobacteriales bacterium]|nr:MAG: DUF4251 domain-containing protein [Flavobacteriales bacterium]
MKKMKHIVIVPIALGMLFIWGCGTVSKNTLAESKALDDLVSQKMFEIQSDWALPISTNSLNSISNARLLPPGSSPNRISLAGNPNYLKVQGDSISAYLPYFGERQMGAGYNSDGGAVQFNGIPISYEANMDEKRKRYEINFSIRNKTETYTVNLLLYPNGASNINMNSTHRFSIRYQGRVGPLSKMKTQ